MQDILEMLTRDARTTPEQMAVQLKRSAAEVRQEVQRLEAEGVILGYHAVVDREKASPGTVTCIIEVKVVPQRDIGFDHIAERIAQFPEVKSLYLLSGTYDLLVFIEGRSLAEVARFVTERLATMDNVHSTATHFLLKKYKQDGVVLGLKVEAERLAVTP